MSASFFGHMNRHLKSSKSIEECVLALCQVILDYYFLINLQESIFRKYCVKCIFESGCSFP